MINKYRFSSFLYGFILFFAFAVISTDANAQKIVEEVSAIEMDTEPIADTVKTKSKKESKFDRLAIKRQKRVAEKRKKRVDKIIKKYNIDTTIYSQSHYDSLRVSNPIQFVADSLSRVKADFTKINIDSLSRMFFTDTLRVVGGTTPQFNSSGAIANVLKLDSIIDYRALIDRKLQRAMGINKDTMSIVTTTLISTVVPGFAQIRNRDYWKLAALYGGVGGFTGLGVWTNHKAQNAKAIYNQAVKDKMPQNIIDGYHKDYNSLKTQRTIYYAGAAATYLYFLADGIVNFEGKAKAPAKASLLGLFVPGGGQIYNKSYWKLPIYYGALAGLGYVVSYNSKGFNRFDKAYKISTDGDDTTIDEFGGRYSPDQLKNIRDDYRRNRDLSIFYTCGVYLLGVIEAYVDASFKSFDISDDLAFKVTPKIGLIETPTSSSILSNSTVGVEVKLMIK